MSRTFQAAFASVSPLLLSLRYMAKETKISEALWVNSTKRWRTKSQVRYRYPKRADHLVIDGRFSALSICRWFLFVTCFMSFPHADSAASGDPKSYFSDGRWHGQITSSLVSSKYAKCWAGTVLEDGTTLVLAREKDGSWDLQLSNREWQLPLSRRYELVIVVDFYPRLLVVGEVRNENRIEIPSVDRIPLLEFIENGHTIKLQHEAFDKRYDLEGSAKAIERIRHCYSD